MNSILDSISIGDLQVPCVPKETPSKKDSIIELLKDSEIEFDVHPKLPCDKEDSLKDFNTGFGNQNDIYYETKCPNHELYTPLYKENYLSEFKTEEEQAAARHALGLYNKHDVVAMSLLTAEDGLPTQHQINKASIKQMQKGDQFFTPVTTFNAVLDSDGISLESRFRGVNELFKEHSDALDKINKPSSKDTITSLGDVQLFLQGFNNGETLHETVTEMNQQMLRFEKTGQII